MATRINGNHQAHGPENAEHEIRKAYNCVIESGLIFSPKRLVFENLRESSREESSPGTTPIPNENDVATFYQHAYHCYRAGNKLAAERWARTAKHLARAYKHEAKIAYLEPRAADLPYLEGSEEDYRPRVRPDTTADLLNSVEEHIPAEDQGVPNEMRRYLKWGRKHLETLNQPDYRHDLLRAERVKAAYEYGRVIECMELAYEIDRTHPEAA